VSMGDMKPSAKVVPSEATDEIQPTDYDVLFGRGKPFQDHPGNLRLHSVVNVYKPNYSQARRHEKTAIAEDVVKLIKSDRKQVGRFLKQVDGRWEVVSDVEARAKVSHALRGKSRIDSPAMKSKSAIFDAQMQQNLTLGRLNQGLNLDSMRQINSLQSMVAQQHNVVAAPFASAVAPAATSPFMPSAIPSVYQSILMSNIREGRDRMILQQLATGAMGGPQQICQPSLSYFPNANRLLASLQSSSSNPTSNQTNQTQDPSAEQGGMGSTKLRQF